MVGAESGVRSSRSGQGAGMLCELPAAPRARPERRRVRKPHHARTARGWDDILSARLAVGACDVGLHATGRVNCPVVGPPAEQKHAHTATVSRHPRDATGALRTGGRERTVEEREGCAARRTCTPPLRCTRSWPRAARGRR